MHLISGPTTLRRLCADDLKPFQAYRNDPDIARYQDWTQMADDEAAGFLSHMSRVTPLLRPGRWTQIAVAQSPDDALIGDMGLHLSADGMQAEIGITLASAHHGQGHATRAMTLAAQFLFGETAITRINAYADLRNTASCRLMPRAGFTQTGTEITDGITEAVFTLHRP